MDFLAIGDTVVDEFIKLKEATVGVDAERNRVLSMRWGEKIPYDSASLVAGVGNAANAAVAAARLGMSSGLVSNIGNDRFGEDILTVLKGENVETRHITVHDGIPTNHHYVLSFDAERTILIRHEAYPYRLPDDFSANWLYLSSLGEHSEGFHHEIAAWVDAHPETKLAFQPGTFQIKMGAKKLERLYAKTELLACNKEEAQSILQTDESDIAKLLASMRALGANIVLITDGPNGSFASDGREMLKVPMYPDPSPPSNRTGAGDAMTSTVVVALALGKPLREALRWGPVNSMSVVQHVGAQKGLLSREALERYLADAPEYYQVEPV